MPKTIYNGAAIHFSPSCTLIFKAKGKVLRIFPGILGHSASVSKLSKHWSKDFHVSLFNSRKGSYTLVASDPFSTNIHISNTIKLLSSKSHPKLIAHVLSTAPAQHAKEITFESAPRNQSSSTPDDDKTSRVISFRILTPEFYVRFAKCAHAREIIDTEFLSTPIQSRMIWTDDPKSLSFLFDRGPATRRELGQRLEKHMQKASLIDRISWSLIRKLRRSPAPNPPHHHVLSSPPPSSTTESTTVADIRTFPLSDLDTFIFLDLPHQQPLAMKTPPQSCDTGIYKRILLSLLLTDLIAFGSLELLVLYELICRVFVIWRLGMRGGLVVVDLVAVVGWMVI
ncbi:MAG: hypothetical protein M1834_006435 [Cirrosporium novae-zelandiae]|nr:MAG: hypothetical protein M1834_006435 [Cirrosporium novae-zelandiae]